MCVCIGLVGWGMGLNLEVTKFIGDGVSLCTCSTKSLIYGIRNLSPVSTKQYNSAQLQTEKELVWISAPD